MKFNFEKYPFEKLNSLIKDISPNAKYSPIKLTIGEPKFDTPDFILDELCTQKQKFKNYPKSAGEEELNKAISNFVKRRFKISLKDNEFLSTLGTREVLFNFPQFFLFDKKDPTIAFTNPFYQIYEGAGIASRAKIYFLDLTKENNFKPQVDIQTLKKCNLVILNFPNNPTASTLDLEELKKWVKLALEYDFVLLNDECYSEIYFNKPPYSLLNASIEVGNSEFKNILIVNSLSKRSSAPGLRSGFIAGDSKILNEYKKYRTYVGATGCVPVQLACATAWNDDEHVENFRKKYKKNVQIASEILSIKPNNETFYIWLKVGDDLKVARDLLKYYNVLVLPGSFLGRNGVADGYIRIALVEDEANIKEALNRIKQYLS